MKRKLTHIITYPVKSLGGIELKSAQLTERGLEHDRRWMLVDENHKFLTIRQHPEFLNFRLELLENNFKVINNFNPSSIEFPLAIDAGDIVKARVWDDEVEVICADDSISQWFSQQLGLSCKLVYFHDAGLRPIPPKYVENGQVSLADEYPYLIVGRKSVDDINSKVEDNITYQRFRPNLVFDGVEAYEEYHWEEVKIGTGGLTGIKPCTRCVVTTYDPDTGIKGQEPLKTLHKQKINDKMVFGQHAIMTQEGTVSVGDEVEVLTTKSDPYTMSKV